MPLAFELLTSIVSQVIVLIHRPRHAIRQIKFRGTNGVLFSKEFPFALRSRTIEVTQEHNYTPLLQLFDRTYSPVVKMPDSIMEYS